MTSRDERIARIRAAAPCLSVGLFAGDLGHLQDERDRVEEYGVDMLHLDVSDGRYSPFFLGFPGLVGATTGSAMLDVHLLVEEPSATVAAVVEAGADIVTFHLDSTRHPHRVLAELSGMNGPSGPPLRGVAITPSRPVSDVIPFLSMVDVILVVAIDPGWGGQSSDPSTAARIAEARILVDAAEHPILVGADGAVGSDNVGQLVDAGVDYVVSGGAVFAAPSIRAALDAFAPGLGR